MGLPLDLVPCYVCMCPIIRSNVMLPRPGVNPPSTIPNPIPVDFLIPNPIPVNLAMIPNPIPIPVIFPSAIPNPNPIPISSY